MAADPTKDEMVQAIRNDCGNEPDDFDIESAIYWFAYAYHGGQWSNLYSILSTSPYKPGAIENGVEPDSMASFCFDCLVNTYA